MSSIDNRIVKMQMDNAQFTNAASSTMNVLKKLTESLKFSEGTKGFDAISKAAGNVNMGALSKGVEEVHSKFSMLEVAAVTALVNITNKAVDAGLKLAKSLTIEPIMDGYREYETKMNSIQTILTNTASKGTTLDDVNVALAELNEYSDKTIYNFAQMTDNIGKATAAGVGLGDSVTFVKGLANVAAGFGVDATAMAGATQQMTQALASGTVRLQDWMSMENRGMGGEMLQQALLQTAADMGVYVDTSEGFRYSLAQNWLSSDIFIKTMEKMANDESLVNAATKVKTFSQLIDTMKETVGSGWAVTWENIIGNKEESTELLTSISEGFGNIMGPMADYRNESLATWKAEGGRTAVLNGLKNIMESIGNLLGPIYNAFKKIIDPWNSDRLISLSKGFESITEKLKITDKTGELIGKTFEGVFSIFKLVGVILQPIGALFSGMAGTGTSLIDMFFGVTSAIGGFITKAVEAAQSSKFLENAISFMQKAGEKVSEFLNKFSTSAATEVPKAIDFIKGYTIQFGETMSDWYSVGKEKVSETIEFVRQWNEAYKPMEKAGDFVKGVFKSIQNGIQSFLNFTKTAISNIREFFDSIMNKIKDSNVQAIDFVNAGLFTVLAVAVKKIFNLIKEFTKGVGSFKDSAIEVLDSLGDTLKTYQKDIKADIIKKIAISIALLAASIFIISKVDPARLIPAVTALGVLIAGMMGALWAFNKIDPKSIGESTASIVALVGIATALNILASALVKLSELDWSEIGKSLTAMTGVCALLFVLTKSLDGATIGPAQGAALILMATSLYALAGAMAIIGNLNTDTILKSLGALAAVMTGLSLFLNSTKGVQNATKVALSLIPLSMSLVVLAGALAIFGNMKIDTLQQGFIVLAIALAELSIFTNTMRGFQGNMVSISTGLLILGVALTALSGALAILGNMNIMTLIQGISAMTAVMGGLGLTMKLFPKNTIGISTSLVVLGGAMLILSKGIQSLGSIEWGTIAKGLLVFIGILATFGGAALILAPVVPVMGMLALGLLALGAASAVVGGSLMILATGMTMFAGSVVGGSLALVSALMAVASVIPIFASAVALGLVSFLTVLGYNGEAIHRALSQILAALLQTINDNIPIFIEGITTFLMCLLDAVIILAPQIGEAVKSILLTILDLIIVLSPNIIEAVMTVIMTLLDTLTTNLPLISDKLTNFIITLISDILNNIANGVPKIANAITNIIVAILNTIGENVPRVVNAAADMIIKMVNGLANAVEQKGPEVRNACKRLITAIINEFKAAIKDALSVGGNIVSGLADGIKNGVSTVVDAAKNVASAALKGAKKLLGIHSPSREFAEVGRWSDKGMANGFKKYGGLVESEAVNVADTALASVKSALIGIDDILNDDPNLQPRIVPVLDLSKIQNGSSQIGNMLDGDYSLSTTSDAAINAAGRVSRGNTLTGETITNNTNSTNNTIHNTFNITGDNPKDIANQIDKVLQRKVERRNAVWA